jgi:hypothetical protein
LIASRLTAKSVESFKREVDRIRATDPDDRPRMVCEWWAETEFIDPDRRERESEKRSRAMQELRANGVLGNGTLEWRRKHARLAAEIAASGRAPAARRVSRKTERAADIRSGAEAHATS